MRRHQPKPTRMPWPSPGVRAFCRGALGAMILALVIVLMLPQHARSETLYEALAGAYFNNPAIQAERARQRADDEAVPQATAGWLPKASLSAEAGKTRSRKRQPHYTEHRQPQGVNVTLSQPLFSGFRTLNAKRSAESGVRAGREQLYQTEQAILLDAVTAYMDVIRDRKTAQLRAENVTFLGTELKATQTRQREGDLSKTDVAQARARFYEGEASLAQARADLKSSEAQFEAIIGHRPGRLTAAPSLALLLPPNLSASLATAEQENPVIIAAEFRYDAARFDLKKAYGEFLPTVALDAEHGRDFDHLAGVNQEDDSSLFVRLSMPLYQGGTLSSQVRQAREVFKQREFEATDTRNRITASVHDAWQQLRAAKLRVRSDRLQVKAAQEALNGVKIETEVGERAIFEVLDAQRELVNGRVSLARAQRDVIVSRFTLLAAVGRLSPEHLDLPVESYDPTANLQRIKYRPFSGLAGGGGHAPVVGDYEYTTYDDTQLPPVSKWGPPPAVSAAPPQVAKPKVGGWSVTLEEQSSDLPLPERAPGRGSAPVATTGSTGRNWTGEVSPEPSSSAMSGFDWNAD